MAKRELTPEDHALLNQLADDADEKKALADEARTKCRTEKQKWQSWYSALQNAWLEAREAYVKAYTDHGIRTRQAAWQLRKYSQGLCRQCGDPRLPDSTLCKACDKKNSEHLAKVHEQRRKKP